MNKRYKRIWFSTLALMITFCFCFINGLFGMIGFIAAMFVCFISFVCAIFGNE